MSPTDLHAAIIKVLMNCTDMGVAEREYIAEQVAEELVAATPPGAGGADQAALGQKPVARLTDEQIEEIASKHGGALFDGFIFDRRGQYSLVAFARAIESEVLAAHPAQHQQDAWTLLRVIQRLNGNPYNLTKSECIAEVESMRDAALSGEGGKEGGK